MLKNEGKYRSTSAILMVFALGATLSGCRLNKWLPLESGEYALASNALTAAPIESLEMVRENQLATFYLADGSRAVVSLSSRDRLDWPIGCPANIGSTYMEVLDIAGKPLVLGELSFEKPILMRDCPANPERVVLREDGLLDVGGSACAGLNKCLSFGRQSQVTPKQTAPIVSAKPLPRSMKGYELYSWRDEVSDNWRYTLITGTNRLKTIEEITAATNQVTQSEWVKITVTETENLKSLLQRLPQGTELTWQGGDRLENKQPATTNFRLPESGLVQEIQNYCLELEIELHLSH